MIASTASGPFGGSPNSAMIDSILSWHFLYPILKPISYIRSSCLFVSSEVIELLDGPLVLESDRVPLFHAKDFERESTRITTLTDVFGVVTSLVVSTPFLYFEVEYADGKSNQGACDNRG